MSRRTLRSGAVAIGATALLALSACGDGESDIDQNDPTNQNDQNGEIELDDGVDNSTGGTDMIESPGTSTDLTTGGTATGDSGTVPPPPGDTTSGATP